MVHLQLLAQICSFSFCDLVVVDACEILKMEGYVSALDEEPDAEESPPWPCAEASDDAIVEDGEDLQIQKIDHMHMSFCHISLEAGQNDQIAEQAREIKTLNNQRDQAIKQARHWQAQAQQQRAKVCKLEAEHKELLLSLIHI